MFPRKNIRVGRFYAKDNIRGRTHVREVTKIYIERGEEQVDFLVHNLVGQEPRLEGTTMVSFQKWAEREAVNKYGFRDTSKNRQTFEGDFIIHQFPHPDAYTVNELKIYIGVTVEGLVVTVSGGTMRAGMGGIQFHDKHGKIFGCGYQLVNRITELDGTVIWQNANGSWKE